MKDDESNMSSSYELGLNSGLVLCVCIGLLFSFIPYNKKEGVTTIKLDAFWALLGHCHVNLEDSNAYYGVLLNVHHKIDDAQSVPPKLSLKQLCGNTFSLFLVQATKWRK